MSANLRLAGISGLFIVDKPLGWSSMKLVAEVRRLAGHVRTGHAGTLDPLATGVVICCLGQATKCVEGLMDLPKVYEAEVDLSAFTASDDREEALEIVQVDQPPHREQVEQAIRNWVGMVEQVPPVYSAVKVRGKRAYQQTRKGKKLVMGARTVRIDAIEVLGYDWPRLVIRVACGRGTYIRSLARDVGKTLGTGGHLAALCRTAVGPYTLAQAHRLDRLRQPITAADVLPIPVLI